MDRTRFLRLSVREEDEDGRGLGGLLRAVGVALFCAVLLCVVGAAVLAGFAPASHPDDLNLVLNLVTIALVVPGLGLLCWLLWSQAHTTRQVHDLATQVEALSRKNRYDVRRLIAALNLEHKIPAGDDG